MMFAALLSCWRSLVPPQKLRGVSWRGVAWRGVTIPQEKDQENEL